jgi:hypothetical protein
MLASGVLKTGDQPRITTKTMNNRQETPSLTYRTQTNRMGSAGNSSRMTRDYTRR